LDGRRTPAEPPALDAKSPDVLPDARSAGSASISTERTGQIALATPDAKVKIEPAVVDASAAANFPGGLVILGAVPGRTDEASKVATKQLMSALATSLQIKGITVDELAPPLYAPVRFAALLKGDTSVLSLQPSAERMRATLLLTVAASCQPSEQSGPVRCTLTVQQQTISHNGHRQTRQWTRTGAGSTAEQATLRATELLVERHADWLDGA